MIVGFNFNTSTVVCFLTRRVPPASLQLAVGVPGLLKCLSVSTHVNKIINNGKSSFYIRIKSEMKSVLNFCTGKLCSSFWQTEIQVWRLSSDFVNYFPFELEVFRHLTTEKQWCMLRTLPGIAYHFELKSGVSLTYVNENEEEL